jgi:hypothetical protein
MNLDEMIKEFRRPFSHDDINFKIQTVGNKACLCVAYVDARLVQERLNSVTGGMWTNTNREIFGPDKNGQMSLLAVEATITVSVERKNVNGEMTFIEQSHSDVGSLDNVNENAHGLKAVYSDAFKRAAVHFGIAQSLYTLPTMFLQKESAAIKINPKGKPTITGQGKAELMTKYLNDVERIEKEFGKIYETSN